MEYQVGEKVLCKKIEWSNDDQPLRKIDSIGTITSIKDITEGHTSVYKYEVTHFSGKWYTDNDGTRIERFEKVPITINANEFKN